MCLLYLTRSPPSFFCLPHLKLQAHQYLRCSFYFLLLVFACLVLFCQTLSKFQIQVCTDEASYSLWWLSTVSPYIQINLQQDRTMHYCSTSQPDHNLACLFAITHQVTGFQRANVVHLYLSFVYTLYVCIRHLFHTYKHIRVGLMLGKQSKVPDH